MLLFFSQLFVGPPQTAILLFAFLFLGDGLDSCLLYNVMNLHPYFMDSLPAELPGKPYACESDL